MVLKEINQLQELSGQLSEEFESELHLVITATCELSPLLEIINQARTSFPHTHIRLSIEAMGGPVEKLIEDQADLVIATMDGVSPEQVVIAPYREIQIIPVCHYEYPPAHNQNTKRF